MSTTRPHRFMTRRWRQRSHLPSCARAALSAASLLAAFAAFLGGNAQVPTVAPIRIDCGNLAGNVTSAGGLQWQPDSFFAGGADASDAGALGASGTDKVYASLRSFPGGAGGCYNVPVPAAAGRYLVRTSFKHFDALGGIPESPVFDVQIQNTTVQTIDTQAVNASNAPFSTDFLVFVTDGTVSVCLVPKTGTPYINALEVLPVNYGSYNDTDVPLGTSVILSNLLRINMGGGAVGEGIDKGYRAWAADDPTVGSAHSAISTALGINNTNMPPDMLPLEVFQTARVGPLPAINSTLAFQFNITPIDQTNAWYARWYFAEIDPAVQPGQRLFYLTIGPPDEEYSISAENDPFDLRMVNGSNYPARQEVELPLAFRGTTGAGVGESLQFQLLADSRSLYAPILSAFELYEVIPFVGTALPSEYTYNYDPRRTVAAWAVALVIIVAALLLIGLPVLVLSLLLWRRRQAAAAAAGGGAAPPPPPAWGGAYGGHAPAPSLLDRARLLFSRRGGGRSDPTGIAVAARQTPYQRSEGGQFTDVELTEPTLSSRV